MNLFFRVHILCLCIRDIYFKLMWVGGVFAPFLSHNYALFFLASGYNIHQREDFVYNERGW